MASVVHWNETDLGRRHGKNHLDVVSGHGAIDLELLGREPYYAGEEERRHAVACSALTCVTIHNDYEGVTHLAHKSSHAHTTDDVGAKF